MVVIEGVTYQPNPVHRDGSHDKSQWTVPLPDEHECFRLLLVENWRSGPWAWSLHVVDGRAEYLGHAPPDEGSPPEERLIAVFQMADQCHGYPGDHRRSNHDKPPSIVRAAWLDAGYLRKATVRKIAEGKRCKR